MQLDMVCDKCGTAIEGKMDKWGVRVEPCEICIQTAKDIGYDDGYTQGYDEGQAEVGNEQ
jgi:hypothetical protein